MLHTIKIVHQLTNRIIADRVGEASNYFTRLKGLIGSRPLQPGEGLLISPCNQVHTHMMGYSIDVIFLTRDLTILHIIKDMKPWKFSSFYKASYFVLELASHQSTDLNIGDKLSIEKL